MPTRPPTAKRPYSSGLTKPLPEAKSERYGKTNLYNNARWRTFQKTMIVYNSQCQHIIWDGQCRNPANTVHHLLAIKEWPKYMTNPANVVCLCPYCHSHTPGEIRGFKYVPTKAYSGEVYEHMNSFGLPHTQQETLAIIEKLFPNKA